MNRLYIKGLVRVASRTRMALAAPLSPNELAGLRERALASIRTVDDLAAKHGTRVEHLPGPTRSAYRYLVGINWDSVQQDGTSSAKPPNRGLIRFSGLSSSFERLLSQLGGAGTAVRSEESHAFIVRTAQQLSDNLTKDSIAPSQLTPESHSILAWLRYFGRRNNFDRLVEAIHNARAALTAEIELHGGLQLPVVVHFRPTKSLYRVRRFADATVVQLPTPMICFDAGGFRSLAAAICGDNGARRPVLERTATEAYRAIQAELDGPVGGERSVGAFHDLDVAFLRVNDTYFGGAMAKPRLIWSQRITSCKFGHYNPLRDELMVSATLDSSEVPAYVIDFVVYHELLHKKHGATWQNGRAAVHAPAFRVDERRFAEFAAAEAEIKKLAKRLAS